MKTHHNIAVLINSDEAKLITYDNKSTNLAVISSEFDHEERMGSLAKSEHMMHQKEQHLGAEYYKKIAENIKDYTSILLFGAGKSKDELNNILKADQRFSDKEIIVKQVDQLTEPQYHEFVKTHFDDRNN